MTTIVGLPASDHGLHLLLALADPRTRVALITPEPVEPAIAAYYLELIGIGPGDQLGLFTAVEGVRAFIGREDAYIQPFGDDDHAAAQALGLPVLGLDERFADMRFLHAAGVPVGDDAVATASVQVRIRPDGAVQVLSAHDLDFTGCSFPARGHAVEQLYRYGARTGAQLAAAGAVGQFAVEFDEHLLALGINPREDTHAYETLLALRANALRASDALHIPGTPSWREVIATLRAEGLLWNPVARAGVVVYGLGSLERTGELSLVALGSSRPEADERFASALSALGAVPAVSLAIAQ